MGMGMGMGRGHGGAAFGLMRSFRRDESVIHQQLPPGIVRRIARFAAPYRRMLGVFLVLIVVDAVIGAANPLIYRDIIDNGIVKHHHSALIVGAGAARRPAGRWPTPGCRCGRRWVSARIGEGLIFDMRAKVFAHIQRMPLAFFTRTQTGALVSRLNNDVLGAQQAFTDTFSSVVSNVIGVAITLALMFYLSWPITLVALALTAGLPPPRPLGGAAPGLHHPGELHPERPDDQHHDRAFQRLGGAAGQAVRPRRRRSEGLRAEGGAGTRHRRDPGHVQPRLHGRPAPHRLAGHRHRLRLGRCPDRARHADDRDLDRRSWPT